MNRIATIAASFALALTLSFQGHAANANDVTSLVAEGNPSISAFSQKVGAKMRGFAKNGQQACSAVAVDPSTGNQKITMFLEGANPDCATQDENTYSVHVNQNGKILVGFREFVSNPNEDLEAFLVRISPQAEAFTLNTGWEVCGFVAQNKDGKYGLRLASTRGAVSCGMSANNVPFGMTATKMTYHTHPEGNARPTSADAEFYAENPAVSGRMLKVGKPLKVGVGGKGSAVFSEGDYVAPGYLVAEGKLMYQEGKGTERDVGHLSHSH